MTRLLCGLLTAAVLGMGAEDASAQARTVRHTSTALGAERIFAVLLPVGYADSTTRYPVVYLFHGGGQDHTAFMARTMFPPMARRHGFIVVMPAADRNYSSLSADGQAKYQGYVASELVDYVDANYRTIASPEGRAIAGLSMGGRIATMTALQFPQRFGTVGAFSAALRGDVDAAVERAAGSSTFFYVSCGTLDALFAANQRFVEQLTARKIPHEYHEIPGGEHAWTVWDPEIAMFFDLLSKRIPAGAQSQR